ncbi:dye decolorizing peroxidase/deferrochelatase/peroxidase EfeB [Streptomyces sp. 3330]|uniref:Dyp-type peroxidase n=1 Tax=Streptomyces sp. 3330 TaxID=2817755 RepID=UPI002866783C|nr:Dyp-type peroxidase [Streptomyces sp. 3330]MDR6973817.1 dye decolorizing peroxidase/deferrochelatase/peroxidase EfeB [Streptomyces sp. 3330]
MPKAKNAVTGVPTRRRVLIAGAGLGLTVTACTRDAGPPEDARGPGFHGLRQAGVTTPRQATALLLAYDLDPALRGAAGARALKAVLGTWTHALAETLGSDGSRAARLTATLGIGPALPARLGLRAPAALRDLPAFTGDRLDPDRCGGDLLVQLCADTTDVTEAIAATLTRLAGEALYPRWRQDGFLPPSSDGTTTPRDLLGFEDGTANPTPEECERWVWSGNATCLVVRRVHLRLEDFARLPVHRQEEIIGRSRSTGGPPDAGRDGRSPAGGPEGSAPPRSHVRAVSPRLDSGARMLRRGYSYADGPTDQGLLFLAFMRDPALFARVQRRMAAQDELSGFAEARGSAVAYILPGARPGRPLGAELLD